MNKYFISPLKQRFLSLWVARNEFDEWAKKWQFFFILGLGRSGTNFMADLLSHSRGARVFHEPIFTEDYFATFAAFYDSHSAEKYIQSFRKKEIYLRMRYVTPGIYGEVNSGLRRHAEAIKNAFPKVSLIHLVRDGRDVVRSLMSRKTMTVKDPLSMLIHPLKPDPYWAKWGEMNRFSRLCWFWQSENLYLRTAVGGHPVQFEKILTDYDYFFEKILKPCHINLDKENWESAVALPRNTTREFKISKWEDWTLTQRKIFTDICGDEMTKCGYEI